MSQPDQSSLKSTLMEKNLQKMLSTTQKILIPQILEGHSQEVIQKLLQIPLKESEGVAINETLELPHEMNFDHDKVQLMQGRLRDRELFNALPFILANKELFDNSFVRFDEKVIFKFFRKYQRYSVIVDYNVPVIEHLPRYARGLNNNVWAPLLEKAYAQLLGGYSNLEGVSLRDAIRDTSGLDPEILIYPTPDAINLEKLPNNELVGFMLLTSAEFKNGKSLFECVPNRMYMLVNRQGKQCTLKDYFSNESYTVESPERSFNCLVILKDFPDDYRGFKIDIMTTTHGVPNSGSAWLGNPSIVFQVGVGINQLDVPFVFRLSELEPQDGISGLLLMNQRDIKTFSQSNVVFMSKQNIIQIGGRKQNYTSFYRKLEKSYYTLFVFSTSKTPAKMLLEVFYQGKPSQLEFKFKNDKILEYCVGETDEGYRIIRSQDSIAPGQYKSLLITSPAAVVSKEYTDNPVFDGEMQFLIENELQSELLAVNIPGEPEQTDIYDFNYYGLGDAAFLALLPDLIAESRIVELHLKGNQLKDDSILQLCYELDKAYHDELQILDVSENNLTQKGKEPLRALQKRIRELKVIM